MNLNEQMFTNRFHLRTSEKKRPPLFFKAERVTFWCFFILFQVKKDFLEVSCGPALIFAGSEVSNLMGRFGIVGCCLAAIMLVKSAA